MNLLRNLLATLTITLASAAQASELWIDVRRADEFQAESIPGHLNIPHTEIHTGIWEIVKDKNTVINVYCQLGVRSEMAKKRLEQMGFTHVVNRGGIEDVKTLQDSN
ncbi:rhodanese-like domain-containing protein [Kistimonas asteriae]|uniref:rhodanese-like domain-containing protein n=1 Tax=Kistimonas asteriae TaxID=517724 RepID=UPI001BA64823|nr:rhodanese-like domain-containing protein [Kistimonas asteriae]